ncbi:MAG: hypothetical protein WAZ18_07165 [Alphaproteobacteria bacterium]
MLIPEIKLQSIDDIRQKAVLIVQSYPTEDASLDPCIITSTLLKANTILQGPLRRTDYTRSQLQSISKRLFDIYDVSHDAQEMMYLVDSTLATLNGPKPQPRRKVSSPSYSFVTNPRGWENPDMAD